MMKSSTLISACLVLAATTFLVFSQTLGFEFVNWDDDIYVYNNPLARSLSTENVGSIFSTFYYYAYIPITLLSHSVDIALWGMDARGHHLTNVILHCINTTWVFLLGLALVGVARRDILRGPHSFGSSFLTATAPEVVGMMAGALFFGLHPLRAESAAWISDRKDLLLLFFLLPSLLLYLQYASQRGTPEAPRWYAGTFLFYVLAVLSKSIAIVFPVLLLMIDWLIWSKMNSRNRPASMLRGKVPFVIVSLVIAIVSLVLAPGEKVAYAVAHLEGIEQWLYPFFSLSFYLGKLVFPSPLSPLYPSGVFTDFVLGLITIICISGLTWFLARRGNSGPLLAWFSYLVFLIPIVLGLSSGAQPIADRYSYAATVGLCILIGGALSQAWAIRTRSVRLLVFGGVIGLLTLLSVLTVRQSVIWKTSETLWSSVVSQFPPSPGILDAYVNLGTVLLEEARPDEARALLEKAVETDPTNADAVYTLAHVLYFEGDEVGAAVAFEKVVELDSTRSKAFFDLAVVCSRLGREEEAMISMRRAARLGLESAQEALRSRGFSW